MQKVLPYIRGKKGFPRSKSSSEVASAVCAKTKSGKDWAIATGLCMIICTPVGCLDVGGESQQHAICSQCCLQVTNGTQLAC